MQLITTTLFSIAASDGDGTGKLRVRSRGKEARSGASAWITANM